MAKKTKDEEVPEESGPGLAELIETRRFLGREFLTWLWFESEVFETRFHLDELGECELWLEKSIALESTSEAGKEKSRLTGLAPSGTKEAREALRQGKLPTQARIALRNGDREFSLVFDADALGLSGVKIPALIKGEGEDPFYERMALIEEIEGAVESLYREFLGLRLREPWTRDVVPALSAWMHERDEDPALERYRGTRSRSGVRIDEAARGSAVRANKKPAA
jgi:hypothetical protein